MQDRPLPHNEEFELYVAGCLLNMEDEQERLAKCAITLKGDDFHDPNIYKIVKAVLQLLAGHKIVDFMAVHDLLQENFVMDVSSSVATTALLEDRIAGLKNYAARRKAITAGSEFLSGIYTSEDPLSLIRSVGEDFCGFADYADMQTGKIEDASKIRSEVVPSGISSGFVTHDYNDSGLKGGCMTITTGFRGDGKTTICRQINMACAMQRIPVFNFIGESSIEEEKNNYAMLCALPGEMHVNENIGGRKVYHLQASAEKRFNQQFEGLIHLCDTRIAKVKAKLFDVVMAHMEILATKKGVRLFCLDNMMILNRKKENAKFAEQERIVENLKAFAGKHNVHVNLIAHQAKGQTRVSGVSFQEDMVDTVLRYVRLRPEDKEREKILAHLPFPDATKQNISAILLNEKIRSKGTQLATMLTWDGVRGACIEVSNLAKAAKYETNGYWVRHIGRISDIDLPSIKNADAARSAYKD